MKCSKFIEVIILILFLIFIVDLTTVFAQNSEPKILYKSINADSHFGNFWGDSKLELLNLEGFESQKVGYFSFNSELDEMEYTNLKNLLWESSENVAIGDVNNSSFDDFVYYNSISNELSINSIENGNCINSQIVDYPDSEIHDNYITISDLDLNGLNDIVIVYNGYPANRLEIYYQQSLNEFTKSTIDDIAVDVTGVVSIDFNSSGRSDIIVLTERNTSPILYTNQDNNSWSSTELSKLSSRDNIHFVDMNNDGLVDVISADCQGIDILQFDQNLEHTEYEVLGDFTCSTEFRIVDVNNDKHLDIVTYNHSSVYSSLKLHLRDSIPSTFQFHEIHLSDLTSISNIQLYDINSDGELEFIMAEKGLSNFILGKFDIGNRTFDYKYLTRILRKIHVYDLDNDNIDELIDIHSKGLVYYDFLDNEIKLNHIPQSLISFKDEISLFNSELAISISKIETGELQFIVPKYYNFDEVEISTYRGDKVNGLIEKASLHLNKNIEYINFVDLNLDSYIDIVYYNNQNRLIEYLLGSEDGSFTFRGNLIDIEYDVSSFSSYQGPSELPVFFIEDREVIKLKPNSTLNYESINMSERTVSETGITIPADLNLDGNIDLIGTDGASLFYNLYSSEDNLLGWERLSIEQYPFTLYDIDNSGSLDFISTGWIYLNSGDVGNLNRLDTRKVKYIEDPLNFPIICNVLMADLNGDGPKDILLQELDIFYTENLFTQGMSTSTVEVGTDMLKTYPNPIINKVNLNFTQNGAYQLQIITLDGRVIKSMKVTVKTKDLSIDSNHFPTGYSFIKVINLNSGSTVIKKILKIR